MKLEQKHYIVIAILAILVFIDIFLVPIIIDYRLKEEKTLILQTTDIKQTRTRTIEELRTFCKIYCDYYAIELKKEGYCDYYIEQQSYYDIFHKNNLYYEIKIYWTHSFYDYNRITVVCSILLNIFVIVCCKYILFINVNKNESK